MSTFGDWLRTTIQRRGLTQKTLADLLGVDQGTVSRWAHNKDMRARNIWPLARALRVSPVEVLLAAGASITAVQQVAGHRSLATTAHYAHALPGAGVAPARLLEAALAEAQGNT